MDVTPDMIDDILDVYDLDERGPSVCPNFWLFYALSTTKVSLASQK